VLLDGGNSLASLILDGPSLTASSSMDVGKYNGSDGRFVVKFWPSVRRHHLCFRRRGPGQRGRGAIEIQGGSVVTKNIALGNSSGSHCSCTSSGFGKRPPSRWRTIFLSGSIIIWKWKRTAAERDRTDFRYRRRGRDADFTWGKDGGAGQVPRSR